MSESIGANAAKLEALGKPLTQCALRFNQIFEMYADKIPNYDDCPLEESWNPPPGLVSILADAVREALSQSTMINIDMLLDHELGVAFNAAQLNEARATGGMEAIARSEKMKGDAMFLKSEVLKNVVLKLDRAVGQGGAVHTVEATRKGFWNKVRKLFS